MSKSTSEHPQKKRRIPLPVKLILIFLFILILAFIGLYIYMKQQSRPDRLLQNYLDTFMSKDTDALFDILGFEKEKFITPELFEASLEECHKYSTITSYSLVRAADSSEDRLHYDIQYWDDNRQVPYKQSLILKKSDTKLYFFFDQWQIDNSDFLAKNCSLSIPVNASATLNGTPLDSSTFTPAEKNTAVGKIGNLFIGTHTLTVSIPDFDEYSSSFYLSAGDYDKQLAHSVTASMMTPSKQTIKKLEKDAENLIHSIYENALKEKPFSKLAKKVTFEESSLDALEQAYNTLVANNIKSPTHLTDVDFNDCTSSSSSAYAEDGCYAINILSDIDYTSTSFVTINKMEADALRPKTVTSTKTGSSNSLFTTTFHYRDGKWAIYDTTALDACIYYTKY